MIALGHHPPPRKSRPLGQADGFEDQDMRLGTFRSYRLPHLSATALAGRWLARQACPPRPIVPTLRRRFRLSAAEACEACRIAFQARIGSHQ